MSNGLYTNFSSFTPFSCKIGLIKTLIHRTYAIISAWNLFHDEIKNTNIYWRKTCILPIRLINKSNYF